MENDMERSENDEFKRNEKKKEESAKPARQEENINNVSIRDHHPYPRQQMPPRQQPHNVGMQPPRMDRDNYPRRKKGSCMSFNTFASILGVFATLVFLFFIFKDRIGINSIITTRSGTIIKNQKYTKEEEESIMRQFNRFTPKDCICGEYAYLDNVFDNYVQSIIPIIMNETKNYTMPKLKKNMLLYGMPGTGKSFFVKKLVFMLALNIKAQHMKNQSKIYKLTIDQIINNSYLLKNLYKCNSTIEVYMVRPSDFYKMHVGETEQLTRKFLNFVSYRQKQVPVVVFIDEVEALLVTRSKETSGGGGVSNNVVVEWLTWMDGLVTNLENERIFVIGATNFKDRIDSAILRRFGVHVGIPMPGEKERYEYFETYCLPYIHLNTNQNKEQTGRGGIENKSTVLGELAKRSEGLSMNTLNMIAEKVVEYNITNRAPMEIDKLLEEVSSQKKAADEAAQRRKENKEEPGTNPPGLVLNNIDATHTRDMSLLLISKAELTRIEKNVSKDQRNLLDIKIAENKVFEHLPALVDKKVKELLNPKNEVNIRRGTEDAIIEETIAANDFSRFTFGQRIKHYLASGLSYIQNWR